MCDTKKEEEKVEGTVSESTAQLSLKAAAYAVVDAAMGTAEKNIRLQGTAEDPVIYIALLQEEEMELVLQCRVKKEG